MCDSWSLVCQNWSRAEIFVFYFIMPRLMNLPKKPITEISRQFITFLFAVQLYCMWIERAGARKGTYMCLMFRSRSPGMCEWVYFEISCYDRLSKSSMPFPAVFYFESPSKVNLHSGQWIRSSPSSTSTAGQCASKSQRSANSSNQSLKLKKRVYRNFCLLSTPLPSLSLTKKK